MRDGNSRDKMADSTIRGLLSTVNGEAQPEVSPMLQLWRGLHGREWDASANMNCSFYNGK